MVDAAFELEGITQPSAAFLGPQFQYSIGELKLLINILIDAISTIHMELMVIILESMDLYNYGLCI